MSIISTMASCEASLGFLPAFDIIETSDSLATVLGLGYLNGQILVNCGFLYPPATWTNGQRALVQTSDVGLVFLDVSIDVSGNISLVLPSYTVSSNIITAPTNSSSSSLTLGTAYHNTLGHDVMITVYLDITSALTASILLGVGDTNSPTQQTIISGLTLAALSVIPIPIYLPANYYAKLSTSGTITASISGQIAMPI